MSSTASVTMDVSSYAGSYTSGTSRTLFSAGKLASLLIMWTISAFLIYVYVTWLSPTYSYMGFPLSEAGPEVLMVSLGLVTLSALSLPETMERFSDYFLWMTFYFLYLPAMLYVPLQGITSGNGFWLISSLALSFTLITWLARFELRIPVFRLTRSTFLVWFFALYVVLNLAVISIYGANLRVADISTVYDQRELSNEIGGGAGSVAGYVAGLLSGAFNPFLIAVGLTERRRLWVALGVLGQVLMYSTAAMKFILLSALLMPTFYYLHIKRPRITSVRLSVLVSISCLIPLSIIPVMGDSEGMGLQIVSLVFMRTYGMAGALTGVYGAFFAEHPLTYYSHINVIGQFVHYPYEMSIGQEIGFDMSGGPLNANANFWATDGIAASGNLGVIIIALVVGGFLTLCNGVIRPQGRRLAYIASIPFIMEISNSSFFTSLLTGGGLFLFGMIYLWQGSHSSSNANTHWPRDTRDATVPAL